MCTTHRPRYACLHLGAITSTAISDWQALASTGPTEPCQSAAQDPSIPQRIRAWQLICCGQERDGV